MRPQSTQYGDMKEHCQNKKEYEYTHGVKECKQTSLNPQRERGPSNSQSHDADVGDAKRSEMAKFALWPHGNPKEYQVRQKIANDEYSSARTRHCADGREAALEGRELRIGPKCPPEKILKWVNVLYPRTEGARTDSSTRPAKTAETFIFSLLCGNRTQRSLELGTQIDYLC